MLTESEILLSFGLLIAIVYLIILLVPAFIIGELLDSNLELVNGGVHIFEEALGKPDSESDGFRRRTKS